MQPLAAHPTARDENPTRSVGSRLCPFAPPAANLGRPALRPRHHALNGVLLEAARSAARLSRRHESEMKSKNVDKANKVRLNMRCARTVALMLLTRRRRRYFSNG